MSVLGSAEPSDQSRAIFKWLEHGVFDALKRSFLDKCILTLSADAAETQTIEAWRHALPAATGAAGRTTCD